LLQGLDDPEHNVCSLNSVPFGFMLTVSIAAPQLANVPSTQLDPPSSEYSSLTPLVQAKHDGLLLSVYVTSIFPVLGFSVTDVIVGAQH
jgi:hypothetical protein